MDTCGELPLPSLPSLIITPQKSIEKAEVIERQAIHEDHTPSSAPASLAVCSIATLYTPSALRLPAISIMKHETDTFLMAANERFSALIMDKLEKGERRKENGRKTCSDTQGGGGFEKSFSSTS